MTATPVWSSLYSFCESSETVTVSVCKQEVITVLWVSQRAEIILEHNQMAPTVGS